MALRAVTDHPKFFRLKQLLKLNKSCALGYLEALWHFCGKYTPQGNIGKYTDVDIEAWLEWDGGEGALVAACVKAGWLREDDAHRLIVHDWSQYADEIVHTDLARKCLRFADGVLPKTGRLNKHERARYMQKFPEAKDSQAAASPDDGDAGSQTESDTSQTKSDLVTKPEPEPEPAIQTTPQPPLQGGGLDAAREGESGGGGEFGRQPTADELEELADVNAMRARMRSGPLTWEEFVRPVAQPTPGRGLDAPPRGRRQRWRGGGRAG